MESRINNIIKEFADKVGTEDTPPIVVKHVLFEYKEYLIERYIVKTINKEQIDYHLADIKWSLDFKDKISHDSCSVNTKSMFGTESYFIEIIDRKSIYAIMHSIKEWEISKELGYNERYSYYGFHALSYSTELEKLHA